MKLQVIYLYVESPKAGGYRIHRSVAMTAEASTQDLLPAELTMGTVMLKVGDMKLMTDYYQRALGLETVAEQDGGLYLGRQQKPLVHLAPAPGLNLPSRGEAGLFHTALLFEDQHVPGGHHRHRGPVRAPVLHRQRGPPRQRGVLLQRPRRQRHRAVLGPAAGRRGPGRARTSSWTVSPCRRSATCSNT